MAQGATVVGCQHAADRGAVGEWRIERQRLTVGREHRVHLTQAGARLDRRGQVTVLVGEDSIQPPHVEHRVDPGRHTAPSRLGAGAADDQRPSSVGRVLQRRGNISGGLGLNHHRLEWGGRGCRHRVRDLLQGCVDSKIARRYRRLRPDDAGTGQGLRRTSAGWGRLCPGCTTHRDRTPPGRVASAPDPRA